MDLTGFDLTTALRCIIGIAGMLSLFFVEDEKGMLQ